MSSPFSNVPSDSLPSTVPKLDPTGSNWAIFSIRFEEALSARDRWGHFDGTCAKPKESSPATQAELDAIAAWEKEERIARYMLSQKLPDSAVVRVRKLSTVAQKWTTISDEYTKKGLFARTEMRNSFLSSRSLPGADVRRFLVDLATKREELVSCGVDISNTDYRATIFNSIPNGLKRFASGVHASIVATNPTFEIEPEVLIRIISEEYDRSTIDNMGARNERSLGGRTQQRSEKKEDGDVALSTLPAPQQSYSPHRNIVCWNCQQTGHICA